MKSKWKLVLLCFIMCCFFTSLSILSYFYHYVVMAFWFMFFAGYWIRYCIEIIGRIFNEQKDEMASDYYQGRTTIKK